MTLITQKLVRCGVCGGETLVFVPASLSSHGSADLDSRPAEPARSALFTLVQHCQHCGYAAYDLGDAPENAHTVVRSPTYKDTLTDRSLPEVAKGFVGMALLAEHRGDLVEVGWGYLRAAWICDDDGQLACASHFRRRAAEAFAGALQVGRMIVDEPGGSELLLSDIERRAGASADATRWVRAGLARDPQGGVRLALQFEALLIALADSRAHTIEEVREWPEVAS